MKAFLLRSNRWLVRWGLDLRRGLGQLRARKWLKEDFRSFVSQRQRSKDREAFRIGSWSPIVNDKKSTAGTASGHYFHQDLYVAQQIFSRRPRRHLDVGSRIDGFVAHVAAFREIEVLDIRPVSAAIRNVTFREVDLTRLPGELLGVADSVSCLHALEHIGLGRYGDSIDYDGWRVALSNLRAMVEPGGTLYLSVPTGQPQRVEFNSQRVFSLPYFRDALVESFVVERLAFVRDDGSLQTEVDPWSAQAERSFDAFYGCSIWTLRRPGEE